MRHGKSSWNEKNLFTGWVDIPLSQQGIEEALEGGKKIAKIPIDVIYTSTLVRAHMTLCLAFLHHESQKIPRFIHEDKKLHEWEQIFDSKTEEKTIPVYMAWELNERMYGHLQGLNKKEMAEKFGKEQVQVWRRSFEEAPPKGESLKMTAERTLPYFQKNIMKDLSEGKNVFVSAHGNSLRSIVMHIENLSKDEIIHREIPTGDPLIYEYEDSKCRRLSS